MAANVFGTPITNETLKGMPEYKDKEITRLDRAIVAFEMKNAEGKDVNARNFIENGRQSFGFDSIMCVIYNAIGGPVRLNTYHHGDGILAPSPYPNILANGQWGAFLHNVRKSDFTDGSNLVVYAGKNASEIECQWMYATNVDEPGRCYTEIRPAGYYSWPLSSYDYNKDLNRLKSFIHQANDQGCLSLASIGGAIKSPIFEGIMTLDAAWGW